MRKLTPLLALLLLLSQTTVATGPAETKEPRIQIALLLDVSNSMDGLIDQAKAQLWKIVNDMSSMQQNGEDAKLEIALYSFGDDRLRSEDGYIQQWTPFTGDLDLISEKLFSMTTSGGDEFCGWTIQDALAELQWTNNFSDLKMIVIAGNESFAQGAVDYKKSSTESIQKNVILNTIFCGDCEEGRRLFWEDAAIRGQGKYMCIDQNKKIAHIPTPYDSLINNKNQELNDTYLGYGQLGKERKMMQLKQDENAEDYDMAYMTERSISKSKKVYNNASWDVLDKYEENEEYVLKLDDEDLPAELRGLTYEKKKAYLNKLKDKRKQIQKEIGELSIKRQLFVDDYHKEQAKSGVKSLDEIMLDLIREQAFKKGFTIETD